METVILNSSSQSVNNSFWLVNTSVQTASPSSHGVSVDVLYAAVELVVMVIVLLGNALTVCAVVHFRPLRTVTHVHTVSLAAADLLVGLSMPFHVALSLDPSITDSFFACMLKYWTVCFPAGASVCFLLATAFDRFLAIQMPFAYAQYATMRNVGTATICIWLYSFLMTSLPFFGWNTWGTDKDCDIILVLDHTFIGIIIVGHIVVFLVIIGALYIVIFRTAMRHRRKIAALTIVDNAMDSKAKKLKKDTKAARTFGLVVGVYAFCLLPLCIVFLVEIGLASNRPPELDYIRLAAYFLAFLNSGVNPLIYAWRMTLFRQAYRNLLSCNKSNPGHPTPPPLVISQQSTVLSGHS